jgi:hypothetical protein
MFIACIGSSLPVIMCLGCLLNIYFCQDSYDKLRMDLDCRFDRLPADSLYSNCVPKNFNNVNFSSLADEEVNLAQFFTLGDLFARGPDAGSKAATKLISMIMNGVPLMDTQDYVIFANYTGQSIGEDRRKDITNYPIYGDIFDNLLNIPHKYLILSPENCWTQSFLEYWQQFPIVTQVSICRNSTYLVSHPNDILFQTLRVVRTNYSEGSNEWPSANIFAVVEMGESSESHEECSLFSRFVVRCSTCCYGRY